MESPLYHHSEFDAYECMGCGEMLEVPSHATLKVDGVMRKVRVRGQPENMVLWREMHDLDHRDCAKFKDAEKATAHREFRRSPFLMSKAQYAR